MGMNMDDLVNVNKRPCIYCRPSKQYDIRDTSHLTLINSIVTCDSKYQVINAKFVQLSDIYKKIFSDIYYLNRNADLFQI